MAMFCTDGIPLKMESGLIVFHCFYQNS